MLLSLLSKRALEVDSRDAYGFALKPHHAQGYKNHSYIYKEEEDERSNRWENFLEQQLKSAQPSSSEEICKEALQTEVSTPKEESSSDRSEERDDTTASGSTEEEVQPTNETETLKAQTWIQIKPSLGAVDHMMGLRVKMMNNMLDKQKNAALDHLSLIKEADPLLVLHEETFENYANEVADDEKHSIMRIDEGNGLSSEPLLPWKEELDCLVRGGVPKELRGEVWQAFIGVRTRRVERYYQDLLADTGPADTNKHDMSPGVPTKWTKQIEKDILRTFPGHPVFDGDGRNSLRRLLLAYARHNPSVGCCQAMNSFAGLLLLLMPEENAFWTSVGIIGDYFEGYYTEQMVESQVCVQCMGNIFLVADAIVHLGGSTCFGGAEDGLPDLQEQVDWLKVEMCRLIEDKGSALHRAEELETALAEMAKKDNRPHLILREKYKKALSKVNKEEVIMAESMLGATLQYESGQIKAQASPGKSQGCLREGKSPSNSKQGPLKKMSLLSKQFALSWGDKNKGNATSPRRLRS